MSSDIAEARKRLSNFAKGLTVLGYPGLATQIHTEIIPLMIRSYAGRRAPTRSKKITPKLRAEIIAFAAKHPDASYQWIANWFGTNPGRVSEVLTTQAVAA